MKSLKVLFISIFVGFIGLFLVSCSGSKHEHTVVFHEKVEATCTTNGSIAYYECSECHRKFEEEACENLISRHEVTIEATGHVPGADANCTDAQVCTVCNEVINAAKGHTPGAEANCTDPQECTVCHVELAPAKGHTPGAEANCTDPQTCTVCNAEIAPAKGHTPGAEANCTDPQTCTVCNTQLAPAKGHTPGAEANCTDPQTCTVCHVELAPAKGHTPGAAANCTDPQICTVCNAELAPVGNHTLVHHPATAPVVGSNGNKEYYECSNCNKYFNDEAGLDEIVDKNVVVYGYLVTSNDAKTPGYYVDYRESYTFVDANGTGTFVSNNSGVSSSGAYMDIFFTAAGTVTFDWAVSSESSWDKFNLYACINGSYSQVFVKSGEDSGTLTFNVVPGDYIYFQYNKDSGGNKGSDCTTISNILFITTDVYSKHTLSFNTNGGNEISSMNVFANIAVEMPEPVKEGYFFDGWYTDEAFNNAFNANNGISADTTVYAKYVAGVTVSFANTQNSAVESMIVKPNTAIIAPSVIPTSDTQYFNGWYQDAEGTITFDFASGVSVDTVVYAGWRNPVVVSFESEGDFAIDNIYTDINVAITLPAEPVRSGYRFDGWYQDASFNTTFDATSGVTTDTVVYVKWVEQVVITYMYNGEVVGTDSIDINDYYYANTPDTFNETVTGWYTDEALTTLFHDGGMVGSSITLYAKVHSIAPAGVLSSFVNGGSNYEWTYDSATDTFTSSNKGVGNSNAVLQFTFAKQSFVSFNYVVNSESNYDFIEIYVNGTKEVTTKVSGFNGIDVAGSYTNTFEADDVLEIRFRKDSSGNQGADQAIISGLIINDGVPGVTVTIDFNDDNVENVVLNAEINSLISDIENFDSYTPADSDTRHFGGWYYDEACTNAANASDAILKNITLYAKYLYPATVTFDTDGAGEIDAISVWTGVDISSSMPANPSKAGYIFRFWLDENAEEFDPTKGVAADMLLTAYFEELPVGSTIEEAMEIVVTDGSFNSGTVTTTEEFQNFYLTFTPETSDYYYFYFNQDDVTLAGGTVNNKNYRRYQITDLDGNTIVSETSSDTKVKLEAGTTYIIRYNLAYGSNKAWGSFVVEMISFAHDTAAEAINYTFGSNVVINQGVLVNSKETMVYAYTAENTDTYALFLGATAWTSISVYDDENLSNRVVYKTVTNSNATLDFATVAGHTYYIVIGTNGSTTNTITFRVNNYPQGFVASNPYNYVFGEIMDIEFTNGTTVYYAVEVTEAGTYNLSLLSNSDTNNKTIEVYSSDNLTTPIVKIDSAEATTVYAEDLTVGTYIIKAFNTSSYYTTSFTASFTKVAEGAWWSTAISTTLDANNTLASNYYVFSTGSETLWYFLEVSNGSVAVYDAERVLVGSNAIQLAANTEYFLVVTSDAEATINVTTLTEYADGKSPAAAFTYTDTAILLPTTPGSYEYYFKFTAPTTGSYRVYTYNNGAIDTKGYIFSDDSFSTKLQYVDDGYQEKVDAGFTGYKYDTYMDQAMEAGVTYYIKVTYTVSSSTNVGTAGVLFNIVLA